ncbi:coiled-coil domain-containing protein 93 isoform X2 [Fopius arisanus]|nr:PREDICTED: coiled-coil domain-containing protein 93 isoform X2 [Fopius arisanus]
MTWCIESCNFDVDVNLLFHENLTIGQKIALTEKIVAMLPIMNCPHCIEPHQIQGLDCIHIFPVIQWLVKRSMEMRKEMAGFVREFAINQFGKLHSSDGKTEKNRVVSEDIEANLKLVKRAYEPRRRFKRATAEPKDEISRVKSTLLEYGNLPVSTTISEDFEKEQKSSEVVREVDSENSGARLVTLEEERLSASAVGNIVGLQAQEIIEVSEKYASLSTEAGDIRSGLRLLIALEKQRLNFQYRVKKLKKEREMQISEISEETEKLEQIQADRQNVEDAFVKMSKMETEENKGILLKLEELLAVHAGLKDQEHKFREQCKSDLMYLQKLVKNCGETCEPQEEQNRVVEYDALKESINKTRLLLAKKNRAIALLMRQLDDVPGRSELTQYQRRFMELYNQVSTKHKETKQYYTLYNTLDDTKLYLSKELSLLNSIQENYNEAMASVSGKEQFLKQFEAIISGVKRNREKVEKKCAEEKERRFNLNKDLVTLVEQQRKYVAAVRQLTIECRKNEALLGRLRAS